MKKLDASEIMSVKGKGFLINRGTTLFSGRIVAPGTVFTAQNLKDMAELAEKFGNGKLICTSRQAIEIPGIEFEAIPEAIAFAEDRGLRFGGTGAKVRPVTACKGTTCIFGNFDTQALAEKIHTLYYIGWDGVKLPHKFKIAVGGCPNSCIKPSLNDFGIEGNRPPKFDESLCRGCKACAIEKACPMKAPKLTDGKLNINTDICNGCGVCTSSGENKSKCPFGAVKSADETLYRIYVGGTWGKRTRMGTPLPRLVKEDEILPILEKAMLWFKENAYVKERFGLAIDRIGIDKLESALFSDDILNRKDEILSRDILTR